MYNTIIDGIPGYHKRRDKITEIQEYKILKVPLVKAKPVIIARAAITSLKISEDLGLMAVTTSANEILLYSMQMSEKIEAVQEPQEKGGMLSGAGSNSNGQLFNHAVVGWQQERLIVLDDTMIGIYDCSDRKAPVQLLKKKHAYNFNARICELQVIFGSYNSGLILISDKGIIYDYSIALSQPIFACDLQGTPIEYNYPLSTARERISGASDSERPRQLIKKLSSLTMLSTNLRTFPLIDSCGKSLLAFLEDAQIHVNSVD